jgi:hypothetical protein
MSANPAKPISSIAGGGISGTDGAGCGSPILASEPVPVGSGGGLKFGGGSKFGNPFGFPKSDVGAEAPSTMGGVTSQHAGGKVPWITPDGEVMAKLLCAAIISDPKIGFALGKAPPPKGGFEPGRFGICGGGSPPASDPVPGLVAMRELRSPSITHRPTAAIDSSLEHEARLPVRCTEGFEGRSNHNSDALTEKPPTWSLPTKSVGSLFMIHESRDSEFTVEGKRPPSVLEE